MNDMPTPEPELTPGMAPVLAEEPLDIQHDPFPGDDHGLARRTPHLGHALLFFGLAATVFVVCFLVLVTVFHGHLAPTGSGTEAALSIGAEGLTYILTLVLAWRLFPLVWKRSFLDGIHWNGLAARRYLPHLVSAGILLSVLAQIGEHLVPEPSSPEIEHIMRTPLGAWSAMLLGTLIAPVMEEIAFRGFLLPAFATAYDWLSLNRTAANVRRWSMTTGNSRAGLVFGAVLSSVLFALMHAPQLQRAWGPVALLLLVSLVLSYIRIRTRSVACSTIVHLTYNLTIFVLALIATGGFRHLDRL